MAIGDEKRRKSAFMLLGQTRNGAGSMAGQPTSRGTPISLPAKRGRRGTRLELDPTRLNLLARSQKMIAGPKSGAARAGIEITSNLYRFGRSQSVSSLRFFPALGLRFRLCALILGLQLDHIPTRDSFFAPAFD